MSKHTIIMCRKKRGARFYLHRLRFRRTRFRIWRTKLNRLLYRISTRFRAWNLCAYNLRPRLGPTLRIKVWKLTCSVTEYLSRSQNALDYPRKQENIDHYGSPSTTLDRSPLKPISLAELDRPATPLLTGKDGHPHSPSSPYDDAPPRPPLPNMLNHGKYRQTSSH